MSARAETIIKRRAALVLLSEARRFQIKQNFEQLRPRIEYVATALRLVNSLRSKIGLIGSVGALLIVRRPRTVTSWLKRGWIIWQLRRRLKGR
jgi:YqjK-like protein